jgi:hypothetical protein
MLIINCENMKYFFKYTFLVIKLIILDTNYDFQWYCI